MCTASYQFMFLLLLSIPDVVILQIATLVQSKLRTMTAGDASQTAPVQIAYVFVLCCSI